MCGRLRSMPETTTGVSTKRLRLVDGFETVPTSLTYWSRRTLNCSLDSRAESSSTPPTSLYRHTNIATRLLLPRESIPNNDNNSGYGTNVV
ncbi:hypothetical protein J6590_018485 [Homalodisca vitripennis]|nr:hypothetical protein J6590_018485 [Homalodisca vitripennis]